MTRRPGLATLPGTAAAGSASCPSVLGSHLAMYIGIGTVVLILVIVLIIFLLRGRAV